MTDDARAKRLAELYEAVRLGLDFSWIEVEWLLAELRKAEAEVAAARAIMQGFADAAIMVTASLPPPKVGELSAAPTSCWRELHAYLDDPERFVEAARDD